MTSRLPENLASETLFSYEPSNPILDEVNLRILGVLRADPRLPMSEVGRRVRMSAPAVSERVRRLTEAGIIRGYRLDLNPEAFGLRVTAYVRVRPSPGQLPALIDLIRRVPEVVACDRVTGEDCLVLRVCVPAMDQLDRLLDCLLVHGLTTTSIVQSSPVPERPLPVPAP